MVVHFMTYISASNVTVLLFAVSAVTFTVSVAVAAPTAAAAVTTATVADCFYAFECINGHF